MIGVLIIPTGIGAEIGGHAGDANRVAKLIGGCCDRLILHPNVVNASDINEMPENALYVEGSILDRFLEGKIQLKEVHQNRILVVANGPVGGVTINAVSAARATVGIRSEVLELDIPFRMVASIENGRATGDVSGCDELLEQVAAYKFDALAIHTPIEVSRDMALNYYRRGGVNPWGGVEAKASRMVADSLNKPVAHAPLESVQVEDDELYSIHDEVVDPRIAAEAVSICYLHCILKGLNRAPVIGEGLKVGDVDFMVSPFGCFGRPHVACLEAGIPIIMVKENRTILSEEIPGEVIVVDNYLEVFGIIMAMKVGILPESVRRPLERTEVVNG